jgi:ABC-type branched-subunit amino acid transport system permease subunit
MTLENVVSSFTERWSMVLGIIFIFTMIFAPEGILGKVLKMRRSYFKKGELPVLPN